MSRLFRYYQERANEVALLGGMVNILAIVGIGINIHDMKETQKMEQMLLTKQWVSTVGNRDGRPVQFHYLCHNQESEALISTLFR